MSDPFTVEINEQPIVLVLAAPALYQLVLNPAPQLALALLPNPVYQVSIPPVVHPIVQIVQQSVQMVVNLATGGVRGLQGEQGPPGVRGSLLLGNYASFANLPPLINFLPGDYAIVNDTGEIFQIKES